MTEVDMGLQNVMAFKEMPVKVVQKLGEKIEDIKSKTPSSNKDGLDVIKEQGETAAAQEDTLRVPSASKQKNPKGTQETMISSDEESVRAVSRRSKSQGGAIEEVGADDEGDDG